jgi:predicted kinase
MPHQTATLHMLCGKAGAGKSTLCAALAAPGTILIAQDHFLATLYKRELRSIPDYIRLVPRLRGALGPHITDLLRAGVTVILDWPANTAATRAWMRTLFEAADAAHQLHVLDVPDDLCLARLRRHNDAARHPFTVTRADFDALAAYFEPPTVAEGFNMICHRHTEGPPA